jgi:hypothetical protein
MWGMPYQEYPGYWAGGTDPSKNGFGGTPTEYAEAQTRILSHIELWEQSVIKLGIVGYIALEKLRGEVGGRSRF